MKNKTIKNKVQGEHRPTGKLGSSRGGGGEGLGDVVHGDGYDREREWRGEGKNGRMDATSVNVRSFLLLRSVPGLEDQQGKGRAIPLKTYCSHMI
jgi:hypothetical protein